MRESAIAFFGFLLAVNQVTMLKGEARVFEGSLRAKARTTG
jgi:hypothetical protein